MEQHVEEQEMTVEELKQRKEEMLKFYTDSLPYLDAQLTYEKKLAELDETRLRRAEAQVKYAMLMEGHMAEQKANQESEEEITQSSETEGRKLKKN